MSKNIFNDVNNLGPILNNISNQIVSNESVLTLLPNNTVLNLPISTFGKSLMDSTSLADLRSQILENTDEEAIRLTADSQNEINFFTGGENASNLRLQITDANTTINNNLIMNNSKTLYLYDNTHTIGSERDKDNIKNSIWGLNDSASDYGTISLCAGGSQNKLNKSRVQLYGYGVAEKIQMLIGDNKLYTISDTQNTFYRPIYVNWNNGNGKKITIQGGNCDYSLYTSSIFGGAINLAHNITYEPVPETESVTTDSLFTSKIIVSNDGIKFRHSNSVNTLPTTDIATFSNNSCDFNQDINLAGTSKLNFSSSNNYLQNDDANNNLNLHLASNKNFVADTDNDKSSYLFRIDGNNVLYMKRDLTTNPLLPVNKTQVSSGKLTVKDDNVAGGYVELERTGPSGVLAGYINYYNSSGRLFYTGFNDDNVRGNAVHFFEDQNLSYLFKNSQSNIMKIVSHDGVTYNATSNYVEIENKLICPLINTTNIKSSGTTLDLYADTHSIKNNAGVNKITITSSTDTTHIDTNNTHIKGNIFPSFNGGGNLGVGLNDANTKRYNNLYLYNSLDINGNSGAGDSAVILRDDSIADNTIRDNTYCTNMILGTNDAGNTSALGRGFLRLGAGYNTPNIIETYIDLYGANSTGTFQQIKHRVNDADILTLKSINAEFHQNLISRTIYPEADISYDLGVSGDNEWRNVYTENIFVAGQQHHSDRRIKDNIIDLPNDKGLEFIQQLRPVQYTYIKSTQKRKHWGFIAQEIREVVGSDNYSIWGEQRETEFKKQHIAPSEFLGPIVKSIQELYQLLTNTDKKPIIIKQQQQGVQEHKCNNLELITQLNSYEVQLLENEEKLNKMDKFLEEVIEDKEKLEVNNKLQDLRIIELENKVKELVDKKEDTDLMTEDDGDTMFDIMNKRMIELENRLIKTENKNKKLTSAFNKMIKEK